MTNDNLKKFVALREGLIKEKAELEQRLIEINNALNIAATLTVVESVGESAPVVRRGRRGRKAAVVAAPAASAPAKKGRAGRARGGNKISLRDAVLKVTSEKPLGRKEILDAVKALGYKFTAKDPLNSLSTLLYTDKAIKNYGGAFGPA